MGENNPVSRWDRIFADTDRGKPVYDDWLDKHEHILRLSADLPVIDLGCGYGCDTLYLAERGYRVISCDISEEALKQIRRYIPEAETVPLNLLDGLPFADGSAALIIADLSLHYFRWADTVRIAGEIRRVLQPGGYLLCRVNSIRDELFGAGQGRMAEPNYYETEEGHFKRFFEREDLLELFKHWNVEYLQEADMHRYGRKKVLWEAALHKA
ncbi:class I SAM-dependent methyltransferase [Paenibacillus hamazuiensis]|uniref:class I SAM-dependent methyltransferase n=1 Tax=Paenibacillus hamazuiensis TaxID=2936508 RepID=UPI00200E6857|nr:class I SAM-dependent methyltransferase [Paenibacillus hamazuiensis]